ncbi:glucokinase [Roseovarius sp. E0-M6]|uniref:glucokinase n=1 Tax=Roseovarius sp. E0-M6 TaxID=3127118 RepID=UPI0030101B6A
MTEPWLVADVGGTTTRLGLAGPHGLIPETTQSLANDCAAGFVELASRYLAEQGATPAAICAGVAGPVKNGAAQLTNRDWRITASALAAATGARDVHLINDLQAQGYALNAVSPHAITALAGPPAQGGARLVLGLGTGCNIAVVHDLGGTLFVPPAEAGHSRLPYIPALAAAMDRIDDPHLPVEAFLSGSGLVRLHTALGGAETDTGEILKAIAAGDPVADATMTAFGAVLGHVAGSFALIHMATGGLFLIGGLARAIAPHLSATPFRDTFESRGPYTHITRTIPVSLILDDDAGLLGCWEVLRQNAIGAGPALGPV